MDKRIWKGALVVPSSAERGHVASPYARSPDEIMEAGKQLAESGLS
jgi:hypothetical protein